MAYTGPRACKVRLKSGAGFALSNEHSGEITKLATNPTCPRTPKNSKRKDAVTSVMSLYNLRRTNAWRKAPRKRDKLRRV